MGHYLSEISETFDNLSTEERLSLELKLRFEEQKKRDLISRNGVRISKGSGDRLIFTPITDEEAKAKRKR